jgi:hypothetical protein
MIADKVREDEGLADLVSQLFTPEVQSAIAAAGARLTNFLDQLMANWAPHLERLLPLARDIAAVFSETRAADYEACLIEIGYERSQARVLSLWAIVMGKKYAEDLNARRRKLGSALRRTVKAADQSTLVTARRATVLLPLLDQWSKGWIENAIGDSGLPLTFEGFHDLVRDAADRQPAACARLGEISQLIFRHFPKARGKSLSTITVSHALLLLMNQNAGHSVAYTHCPYEEDFVDKTTMATRRQFQHPSFSPTGARRLLKQHKWTDGLKPQERLPRAPSR